jgi:hypothetical protein
VSKKSIIKAYFKGLEKGNYEEIVKLFSPGAIVHSPLYGRIDARHFYKELFLDTLNVSTFWILSLKAIKFYP